MEKIEHYYNLVEECIKSLGVDPSVCRGKEKGQWNLQKGSAPVWIDVWKSDEPNKLGGYFQIVAPIMEIPGSNKEALFKELLETNHQLYGVAFTVYESWIYIKMIRELEGLDGKEALNMFHRVGNYADEYDDFFKNKYNTGRPPAN